MSSCRSQALQKHKPMSEPEFNERLSGLQYAILQMLLAANEGYQPDMAKQVTLFMQGVENKLSPDVEIAYEVGYEFIDPTVTVTAHVPKLSHIYLARRFSFAEIQRYHNDELYHTHVARAFAVNLGLKNLLRE